ncbi:MAG: disulfide bond formation protein B [Acidimicrobiales bacterium]
MSTDQVSLFLALLALAAQVATVALVVATIWHRFAPDAGAVAILDAARPAALTIAATVAGVATLGSLYLSEVADFPPCRLCWYQRICMYPLSLILVIAAARGDRHVRWYALPFAAVGAAVSTYHVAVERFPSLESGSCDPTNPCSIIWVEKLGYLTIPTMALSGFVLITVLLALPKEAT